MLLSLRSNPLFNASNRVLDGTPAASAAWPLIRRSRRGTADTSCLISSSLIRSLPQIPFLFFRTASISWSVLLLHCEYSKFAEQFSSKHSISLLIWRNYCVVASYSQIELAFMNILPIGHDQIPRFASSMNSCRILNP